MAENEAVYDLQKMMIQVADQCVRNDECPQFLTDIGTGLNCKDENHASG